MLQFNPRIPNTYYRLKQEMLDAYEIFEANPTAENRFIYNVRTQRWRDFCVEIMSKLLGDSLDQEVTYNECSCTECKARV